MIKVLVVDDSALVRQTLAQIINSHDQMEVIGLAADPYIAVKRIQVEKPDVITLDVEMPRMDGITFLSKIMKQMPIPVVIISSLTEKGSKLALKALEYGATDIITKPKVYAKEFVEEAKMKICDAIIAASKARLVKASSRKKVIVDSVPKSDNFSLQNASKTTDQIVALGASTGGTDALRKFITVLPIDFPGTVVVQHMPELFTRSFAERLNELSKVTVKEAEDGERVVTGKVLIAPGNYHMRLIRSGAQYIVKLSQDALVNRHRPSVDVLFQSCAVHAGKNASAVIMTGMGKDGAEGMLQMHQQGSFTLAQDEKSCVVFGMPKKAIEAGGVVKVLPIDDLAEEMIHHFNGI